jgi:hypothetical protein
MRGVGGPLHARDFFRRVVQSTGLVQEDNQVRLGATGYPMACLYICETCAMNSVRREQVIASVRDQ